MFNAGQRVEAFTSPVWLGGLTLADLITPIRLEWVAVIGGIVALFPARTIGVGSAAVLGFGWLVRRETVLYSIGFLAVVLLGDRQVHGAHPWLMLGAAVRLPIAYEIFRMGRAPTARPWRRVA